MLFGPIYAPLQWLWKVVLDCSIISHHRLAYMLNLPSYIILIQDLILRLYVKKNL